MDRTLCRSLARRLTPFLLLSGLGAPLGCAETASTPSTPAVVFPTRAEVARIPARKALPRAFGTTDVAVDEWRVESPPLPSDGPYEDPSPAGSLLRDLLTTRTASVVASPAMRCAAGELGRFYLKNHALPVERLRRFILARCGGEAPNLAPLVWSVEATPAASDEQVLQRARDALANALQEPLSHGHHRVGLAVTRDAARAVVVFAMGDDEARLEPGARSVDASRRVTLRGTARGDYAQIVAIVNRGDFAVAHCEPDAAVRSPRFALTCDLAPGDLFDWVEVMGQERGHVLLHDLADVLIYEGDAASVHYQPKGYGASAPIATPEAFKGALADRVNGVRRAAKLPELTLAARQSLENERLAGTILDSATIREDDSADKAAIGLLAGWDIEEGIIRTGQFFVGAVAPTNDAMAWLESAVERPSGRLTLLDPQSRVIAIGPTIPDGAPGLGAVVTTYALFDTEDHAADEALFLRRIQAARADRALPPMRRVATPDEMHKLAARVLREELTPRGALDEMLATAAWGGGAPAYGYVLETNDLATVEIPEVFLKQGSAPVTLAITHHRAPGAAWGQYAIFAVWGGARE